MIPSLQLSLVDLAGSERAAKTEASAEQLKSTVMSINTWLYHPSHIIGGTIY